VNQVTVELWGGEFLTVNRSDGFFRCPWCADKTKRDGRMKLVSARAMEVSCFASLLRLGSEPCIQEHLRTCRRHRPHLTKAQEVLASDPTHHPAGLTPPTRNLGTSSPSPPSMSQILPPEPRREVVFSTEVTMFPATADEPVETGVIHSSPTIASLVAELEKEEGVNLLDEEP